MILWRISSSQETKLSHLCPGAIRALSPGPARAPASQSPKPHQRQPFVHHASHWTQEVGGLQGASLMAPGKSGLHVRGEGVQPKA